MNVLKLYTTNLYSFISINASDKQELRLQNI